MKDSWLGLVDALPRYLATSWCLPTDRFFLTVITTLPLTSEAEPTDLLPSKILTTPAA